MPSIPHIIHQTWQTTDYLKWPTQLQVWRTSWAHQADWEYRLWGDAECLAFMQKAFPKLVDIYQALPTGACRADLFRYCVLHEEGGLWADIDSTCMEPLAAWPIDDCKLLVGMQGVAVGKVSPASLGLVRPVQVCQWIMAAAPQDPTLAAVIARIESSVRAELAQNKTLPKTYEAIVNRTGAGVWTDVLLQRLQLPTPSDSWSRLLCEPFVQNDVRVLPMRALAWNMNMRANPKSATWDRVLARHHALATWKSEDPAP